MIIFLIHWLACGYRIAAERTDPTEDPGWVDYFAAEKNVTIEELPIIEVYLMGLYMSSGTISLVGYSYAAAQPTTTREFGYAFFANFVSYFLAVYFIASLADTLAMSSRTGTQQDILVDNYLEMFDRLKLDMRLKVKVNDYLNGHFAQNAQKKESTMMKELPVAIHGFISMEIFMAFILEIPFLEPFVEREPMLTQNLCCGVEIRSFASNTLLYAEGLEGIYYLEHGIVAVEGTIYKS